MPAGQGGLVAMPVTRAATIADFANKHFGGIAFPDNSGPQLIKATTGALSGDNGAPITSIEFQSGDTPSMSNAYIRTLSDAVTATSSPGYPDATAIVSNYASSGNPLHATYATPSAIPGLFRIDGDFGDTGRVILVAMKSGGKTLAFGAVYNWRNTHNGNTDYTSADYVNSGAFILFEK
jgi:hypothetical protein